MARFGVWGGAYGFGAFAPNVTYWTCETTIEIAEGRMLTYDPRGNAC